VTRREGDSVNDRLAPSAGPPEGIVDTPVSLLAEWLEWWRNDPDVPAKLPASLHARTAVTLTRLLVDVVLEMEMRGAVGPLRGQDERNRVWANRHLVAHVLARLQEDAAGLTHARLAEEKAKLTRLLTTLDDWLAEPTGPDATW
jgi:hypothetical protein